jgi:hypothetical protein
MSFNFSVGLDVATALLLIKVTVKFFADSPWLNRRVEGKLKSPETAVPPVKIGRSKAANAGADKEMPRCTAPANSDTIEVSEEKLAMGRESLVNTRPSVPTATARVPSAARDVIDGKPDCEGRGK